VVVPALLSEPFAVGTGALAAGEDDEVGTGFGLVGADELEVHLGVQAQGVEVVVVAHAWQCGDDDVECALLRVGAGEADAVFGVQDQALQVGKTPTTGLPV